MTSYWKKYKKKYKEFPIDINYTPKRARDSSTFNWLYGKIPSLLPNIQ